MYWLYNYCYQYACNFWGVNIHWRIETCYLNNKNEIYNFSFFCYGKNYKETPVDAKICYSFGYHNDFIDADILYSKDIFVLIESIIMFEAELLIITNSLNKMLNNYESTFIKQKYF